MNTHNFGALPGDTPWQFAQFLEPAIPFSRTAETELERLKNRLLRDALAGVSTPTLIGPIRRAANEAAAVAWLEADPLLVFPALFQEKLVQAKRQAHKQLQVQARSEGIFAAVR